MHDSRGAQIKVGDRVLIEAKVTELNGGDENFCCCTVEVVLPDQAGAEKVMGHRPTVSAMSTKMLTKVGMAMLLLLAIASTSFAQVRARETKEPPLLPIVRVCSPDGCKIAAVPFKVLAVTPAPSCECGPSCICPDCECDDNRADSRPVEYARFFGPQAGRRVVLFPRLFGGRRCR